jgi:hypothetical protein
MHETTIHDSHQQIRAQITSESKEQAAHKKPTKIARKRHENPTSYKPGIDATMKASIHPEVRLFRNEGKI